MTARRALLGISLVMALAGAPARAEPSWYKRKKQVETEKAEEAAAKAAEKPMIGPGSPPPDTSLKPLTTDVAPPTETTLLFKKEGLNESISLDYGQINQTELSGRAPSLQYSMGWWWRPNLTLAPAAKAAAIFQDTYVLMFVGLGANLRWFATRNWAFSLMPGFALSQGLSRVSQENVPRPPSSGALGARRGLFAQAQATYFFWPKRGYAIGPTVTFMTGKQSERSFSAIAIGFTYQSGRPSYAGDLTSDW
jgi:hypothetical protein